MLSIADFARAYSISPSSIRRYIHQGDLRCELQNGRRMIDPAEAERWLSEQASGARVRNISRPELPPLVLCGGDLFALMLCGWGYNPERVHAHIKMEWRVSRLRGYGFDIERGWRRGLLPYYRLKDVVEIGSGETLQRVGP